MKLRDRLLEYPIAYRLWQAPFEGQKIAYMLEQDDLQRAQRVLDVGCGPGTNTEHFSHANYLGIDINERYIRYARRRHRRPFIIGDVTKDLPANEEYDFILVNSLLHHIDDARVDRILRRLSALLSTNGRVHIIDLILPAGSSIARGLTRLDRGKYPRPLGEWDTILSRHFNPLMSRSFTLDVAGVTLWEMIYFSGTRRQ